MLARVPVICAEARDGALFELPHPVLGVPSSHMIRRVEHLHAELDRLSLADAEVLDRGEIDVHLPRSAQIVAGAIAEFRRDRVVERGRVVPGGGRRIVEYRIHAGHQLVRLPFGEKTTPAESHELVSVAEPLWTW